MRKLSIIILVIFASLFAKSLKLNIDAFSYTEASGQSKIQSSATKGTILPILKEKVVYYEVDIIKGKNKRETSDHAGKSGYLWAERVDETSQIIIIEGCTLRSSPKLLNNGTPDDTADDPNFVAKVKKAAKIFIKSKFIYWYKTEIGWFYYTRVDIIN